MDAVVYLDVEDLLLLVRRAGVGPVRDLGLLSSAAARPQASAFGTDAYPTLAGKASALLHSLVRNHPLVDGNKRLGWLAAVVFLDLNDLVCTLTDDEAFGLVMEVAEGVPDVHDITDCLVTAPSQAS